MPRSVSYHEGLIKHLQDPLEAASYMNLSHYSKNL